MENRGRGVSVYNMSFSCPWQLVQNIINNWLNDNGFFLVEKKNKRYFVKGNILSRRFFFEYSYSNNNWNNVVTITTCCSTGNGKWPIENKQLIRTKPCYDYLMSIIGLLKSIYNISAQYEQQPSVQTDYHRLAGVYCDPRWWQAEVDKKMADNALYGMIIGIVGLVLNAFGWTLGLFIIIFGLIFSINGLRSDRKYMAYIGIAANTIALVVWAILIFNMF